MDGTIGLLAAEIVLDGLATLREHDGARDGRVAAGRPIVAGVELHRIEHLAAHPDIETLSGDTLDDRRDNGEVEVGVSEESVAGSVLSIPARGDTHHLLNSSPERNGILVVMV